MSEDQNNLSQPIPEGAAETTDGSRPRSSPSLLEVARKHILPIVFKRIAVEEAKNCTRGMLAKRINVILSEWLSATGQQLTLIDQRNVVTFLINAVADRTAKSQSVNEAAQPLQAGQTAPVQASTPTQMVDLNQNRSPTVLAAKSRVQSVLMSRIDTVAAATLPRQELTVQLQDVISEILTEQRLQLNLKEQQQLINLLLDDMLGLGPLEPLLHDPAITDIMVNGPHCIYVERFGKMEKTDVVFRDKQHVLNIATRIVSQVGRRVDETSPMVDARLADGSRVNIIIPPLALDGASISIRRFGNRGITLERMADQGNMSHAMAKVLSVASAARLNIIVSGGTGAGKTTLLNALSQKIDTGERVVTVEDSAELALQQPHVVRLETRPANLEGDGEISIRDLVKNALRMRPDRIIVGECRGGEIIDMLQAMNTGHDGSMSTLHANTPRTALIRMENMLNMAGFSMPEKVTRSMISSAVDLIVQVSRMRDGVRRITHIMEVLGMEENVIVTQDLFTFNYISEDADGKLVGEYVSTRLTPHFVKKAKYFNLERDLVDAMNM